MDNERFLEIQRRAYNRYQFRIRRGLVPDFEPDRTEFEKLDWHIAEFEVNNIIGGNNA